MILSNKFKCFVYFWHWQPDTHRSIISMRTKFRPVVLKWFWSVSTYLNNQTQSIRMYPSKCQLNITTFVCAVKRITFRVYQQFEPEVIKKIWILIGNTSILTPKKHRQVHFSCAEPVENDERRNSYQHIHWFIISRNSRGSEFFCRFSRIFLGRIPDFGS